MSLQRARLLQAIRAADITAAELDAMVAANPMLRADLIDLVKTEYLFQRNFYGIPLYEAIKDSYSFIEAWLLNADEYDLFSTSSTVLDSNAKMDWCLGTGDIYNKLQAAGHNHMRLTCAGSDTTNQYLWSSSTAAATALYNDIYTAQAVSSTDPGFTSSYGYALDAKGVLPAGLTFKVKVRTAGSDAGANEMAVGYSSQNSAAYKVGLNSVNTWRIFPNTTNGTGVMRLWFESISGYNGNVPVKNVLSNELRIYAATTSHAYYLSGMRLYV